MVGKGVRAHLPTWPKLCKHQSWVGEEFNTRLALVVDVALPVDGFIFLACIGGFYWFLLV